MRTLGLDYGDVRIGVAVSDRLGWTAQPLTTIVRKNPIDLKESIEEIINIAKRFEVRNIVLGYPKNMDNSEGENCKKVMAFKTKLERLFPHLEIVLFDERLSTKIAGRIIFDTKTRQKKGDADKIAAAVILQDYLDLKNRNAKDAEISRYKEKNMEFNEEMNENNGHDTDDVELEVIVMTDDEGNEAEYAVIDEFDHNGTTYLIMIKAEDADDEEAEAAIFKQVGASEEEFVYEEIDEEEYAGLEDMLKARLAEFDIDMQ